MLRVPQEGQEAVLLLHSLSRLNHHDFKRWIDWLESERARMTKKMKLEANDVTVRWLQGGLQVLDSLLETIKESDEKSEEIENIMKSEV